MLKRHFRKPFRGLFFSLWEQRGGYLFLWKIAVENGAKPFGVAQFQVMFAGIVLLFVNVIRGKSTQNMRDKLGFIFCIAMLGAAIPSVLFYYAAPHVPAGVLSITVAMIPLMTYGFLYR